ncbi:uncharacterized protein FIESC28_01583 [Fusarium coffeatum]|uniref:F-box domain-containing protein n=1 Tax=Fusarium coffeatum TaxID=231269 RepID=A0A366SA77_9HYPO|nr:uncharacterized protein FIESC28_01583 [Fusarium coffeatum]RBR25620.1 hypothetical protein FIESC28_01583 [Fusarium coffeatum]
MPKPEVVPGRQRQESVPHCPKRRFSQTASPPWDPGPSPPMSPKRPRTTTYTPESPTDSIQGEQSMSSQGGPVPPDPARQPTKQGKFHTDIYLMIVDQVIESGKQRDGSQSEWKETLMSLACTSRLLQGIAEDHIYRHPSFRQWNPTMFGNNLDHVVNRFLFALWARPSRRVSVRNLELAYFATCSNIEQLIDTVQVCPNLSHLTLEWAPRTLPTSLDEQARGVARLLNSCSKKVHHFTFVKYDDERPGQVNEVSGGCSEFYERLTSFMAAAPVSDLMATLLNHRLPDLKYFRWEPPLDRQLYRLINGKLLPEASKTCPALRTLDWGIRLLNLPSLLKACEVWGPTLRSLRVHINDPIPNPISQILPLLPRLEELSVRTLHRITQSDIQAIVHYARSTPLHLQNISLTSQTDPMRPPTLPRIDDDLANLIDAVHPTLVSLHLEYDRPVKAKFIKHLVKAKRLHHFYVEIEGRPKDRHLQLVSRECPRLKGIYFPSLSSARSFVPATLY